MIVFVKMRLQRKINEERRIIRHFRIKFPSAEHINRHCGENLSLHGPKAHCMDAICKTRRQRSPHSNTNETRDHIKKEDGTK